MKKIIPLVLCALIVFSACFVSAFASDGSTKDNTEINFAPMPENDDNRMLIITFDSKYVSFADDTSGIAIDITTKPRGSGNDDEENYNEEDCSTVSFSGNDLAFVKETWEEDPETGIICSLLYIYIPHAGNIDYYNFYKAEIPSNTVFDVNGKGNEKICLSIMTQTCLWITDVTDGNHIGFDPEYEMPYEKSTLVISFSHGFPADYYYDGKLVAKNTTYYVIDKAEIGTHTVCAKKFGIVVDEITFTVCKLNKAEAILCMFGSSGMIFLTSLFAFPLSPLLFLILPPLGAAGLASPFIALESFVSSIVDSFKVLFM
ncbi:MAG: hypothetical protein IK085_09505 [Clostridia bacterium]|nr:hypothetical protein [Clostridia bacterium]